MQHWSKELIKKLAAGSLRYESTCEPSPRTTKMNWREICKAKGLENSQPQQRQIEEEQVRLIQYQCTINSQFEEELHTPSILFCGVGFYPTFLLELCTFNCMRNAFIFVIFFLFRNQNLQLFPVIHVK